MTIGPRLLWGNVDSWSGEGGGGECPSVTLPGPTASQYGVQERAYLQLEEVCPTVVVLLVDLQIATVEVVGEVIPSFTCTEPLIGLKEFIKSCL